LHDNRETNNSDKKVNHNYKNEDLINAASPTTRSIDETIIKKFYIQLFNYEHFKHTTILIFYNMLLI
jgi:hypothetical protein